MTTGKRNRGRNIKHGEITSKHGQHLIQLPSTLLLKMDNCGSTYHMLVRILTQAEIAINDESCT